MLTKSEAQAAYRRGWLQRCMATDLDSQKAAERIMDAVQGACVDGGRPGPEWEAFIDTLPGYREHWVQLASECARMVAKMEGNR